MTLYGSMADDMYVNVNLGHGDGAAGASRNSVTLFRMCSEKISDDAEVSCS